MKMRMKMERWKKMMIPTAMSKSKARFSINVASCSFVSGRCTYNSPAVHLAPHPDRSRSEYHGAQQTASFVNNRRDAGEFCGFYVLTPGSPESICGAGGRDPARNVRYFVLVWSRIPLLR